MKAETDLASDFAQAISVVFALLLLKKNGQTVYATWVNSSSDVLANGKFPVTIYAPKNIDYDSFDLIAIPC